MCGSTGGCFYSTTLEDKQGPANYCVFKGPGVIKPATLAPIAPTPTTKAPSTVTSAPVPKPSTAAPVVPPPVTKAPTKPATGAPVAPVTVAPAQLTPTTKPSAFSSKCGGAVNVDCASYLWNPTNYTRMHCYGYGGPSDSCALHNNNDFDEGLTKDPSACLGDTFYLWDEVRVFCDMEKFCVKVPICAGSRFLTLLVFVSSAWAA
jgi:hypothetical protein